MEKFWILKGCHYSNFIPRMFRLKGFNFMEQGGNITFTDSCRYEINEDSCVNKLFGFSFGIFGVHKNSVRFGWTYDSDTDLIYIWKYVYKDGKLFKEKIFSCNIGETHKYYINTWLRCNKNDRGRTYEISFRIDDKKLEETETYSNKMFALTLGPYFGGNTRAPHKMCIISKK